MRHTIISGRTAHTLQTFGCLCCYLLFRSSSPLFPWLDIDWYLGGFALVLDGPCRIGECQLSFLSGVCHHISKGVLQVDADIDATEVGSRFLARARSWAAGLILMLIVSCVIAILLLNYHAAKHPVREV